MGADAFGGNEKYKGAFSKKEKAFPAAFPFIWGGGRTCGECAKSPEKVPSHGKSGACYLFFSIFPDAVFFYPYPDQPEDDLLCKVSGCLGYYGHVKRYTGGGL